MRNVQFRLPYVAQKRLCLSSLFNHDDNDDDDDDDDDDDSYDGQLKATRLTDTKHMYKKHAQNQTMRDVGLASDSLEKQHVFLDKIQIECSLVRVLFSKADQH